MDCFTTFKSDISGFSLPERFTFPFYYEPHPISILASNELAFGLGQRLGIKRTRNGGCREDLNWFRFAQNKAARVQLCR